jgi:hypothetical protein
MKSLSSIHSLSPEQAQEIASSHPTKATLGSQDDHNQTTSEVKEDREFSEDAK